VTSAFCSASPAELSTTATLADIDRKVAARTRHRQGLAPVGGKHGFRAPSLGQEFFSSTATNFIAGVPFDVRTFP
jgi:iron complex outermembrane receptor protein